MKSKGSEWHRWDLHFHTPSSYDYGDNSVTNQDIIAEMLKNNISAFAVTDHHEIDIERYKELSILGQEVGITVLPGIEFLSDARGKDPIHFIGIFPETSDIEYIWDQIKNTTAIKKVRSEGKHQNQVYCDLEETIILINELNGISTIHAGGKSGSIENITHALPHGEAQKTEIAKKIDIYELGKECDQEGYKKYVFPSIGKTIPMIICSDNHNIKKYITKQKLWIKGTPNFEGLKYSLNEPECRFYIGEEPPILKRVRENKTKYIKSLSIKRTGRHDQNDIWFEETNIPLNNELVSIIGNKGNGKSAISDIIALCANTEHSTDFLFLQKNKFKKKGLADRFSASLTFESNITTEDRSLDHNIDESQVQLVRYLPQSYFEKVCNEIGKVEALRKEIEKVVFQYVPQHKRLNKTDFKDLIDFKKESIDKEISHLTEEISQINNKIITLEDKTDPEYRKNIISKKKIKEEELTTHITSRPPEQIDPATQAESEEIAGKKISLLKLNENKELIEKEIAAARKSITEYSIKIEELSNIKRGLKNKTEELSRYISEKTNLARELGVDLNSAVKIETNFSLLDEKIQELEKLSTIESNKLITKEHSPDTPYSALDLHSKLKQCATESAQITSELSSEQAAHQAYIDTMREWEKTKLEIQGDSDIVDSLVYLEKHIEYIDNQLTPVLTEARNIRLSKTLTIFEKKSEIKEFYDEIKSEINGQLSTFKVTDLEIASTFHTEDSFKGSILRHIKQNRTGSFYGAEDGATLLQENLISTTDWNDSKSIENFLTQIIEHLEIDKRTSTTNEQRTYIGDIVKNRSELYDYLFSLKYVEPSYDLQQGGKSLEQLSPGEKGALLLVFYLVLDKEDIPLIIDQPEDNLDNNSVAKILVPFIREAKKKRQIILITHNPNLAVVSDSEQIIRVSIDKKNGNTFDFVSGGIENKIITDVIINVLEGTVPAFSLRKNKYQIK